MRDLIEACEYGDLKELKSILKSGIDINKKYKDRNDETALIVASKKGNLEIVKCLIENRADVNAEDNDGWTALMYALNIGRIDIAEYLIEKGAKINAQNVNGATALLIASSYGHSETVKYLLEKGADINIPNKSKSTALIEASSNRDLGIVKLLLSEIEKRKKDYLNAQDNYGFSALMYASYNLHLEIVKLLIENGAKVNEKNNGDWTALMYALDISNNLKIEKPLSESEEDIIANNNGYTTSKWYLFKRSVKLVEYLIKNGAKVNIKNKEGKTALDLAENEDIKKLLEKAMGK